MNELATIVIFAWITFAVYIYIEIKEELRRDKK